MKLCIRKSAAISHTLLQPGESTHFLCSSKNQHRNQMIHFISIKSFTEPQRHKWDLWLFRGYSVKNRITSKTIFLKLNANQIGPNLLSICLVPLAIVPRNLIWLFSIYMALPICCFKKSFCSVIFNLLHEFWQANWSHFTAEDIMKFWSSFRIIWIRVLDLVSLLLSKNMSCQCQKKGLAGKLDVPPTFFSHQLVTFFLHLIPAWKINIFWQTCLHLLHYISVSFLSK